jgi:hypothetical protein
MNRLCASLTLGVALMASAAIGAQANGSGVTLGGPVLLGQPDLPMPTPLPSPTLSSPTLSPHTTLSPTPEIQYSGPVGQLPVVTGADPTLFPCVKYRAVRNIAPCAVPVVVQVPDPCAPKDPCGCAPRPCVNVQICVPANGCPNVCVTRHGNKTRYDYGKYAVNVITHHGRIVVDYDD